MNCLVFISNNGETPEVGGTTRIAEKLQTYDNWTNVILLTDSNGNNEYNSNIITVSNDNILSDRPYIEILPKKIYYFSSLLYKNNIVANNFVIKDESDNPLRKTTENGLGSGINGHYIKNIEDIELMKIDPDQFVYEILYQNPLNVQDSEHGDSITTASLETNSFLDGVIRELKFEKDVTFNIALNYIYNIDHSNILNLWNIVFYRDNKKITDSELDNILANYIVSYFNDKSLIDNTTNQVIQQLPINNILAFLGYDGIIASDSYNNGWYRGCYCYDYSQATILKGDISRY